MNILIKTFIVLGLFCFIFNLSLVSGIKVVQTEQSKAIDLGRLIPTISINYSTTNVNSSSYWGNYFYSDYDMLTIKIFGYNMSIGFYLNSNPSRYLNTTNAGTLTRSNVSEQITSQWNFTQTIFDRIINNNLTASKMVLTNASKAFVSGVTFPQTMAAGSILGFNTLNIGTAITSTSGTKVLQDSGTTISWASTMGTGSVVMATAPTITAPNITGNTTISYGQLNFVMSTIMGLNPCGTVMYTNSSNAQITAMSCWIVANGSTQKGVKTDDLRDRWIVGAGTSYSLGQTGGSVITSGTTTFTSVNNNISLPTVQVPTSGHTHPFTSPYEALNPMWWACGCGGYQFCGNTIKEGTESCDRGVNATLGSDCGAGGQCTSTQQCSATCGCVEDVMCGIP